MSDLNPDEIPVWLAIPAGLVLWGTWIAICVGEAREKLRRMGRQ
ncbi:hypothetical protein [Microbacterium oleivorans]|nr:hypothetical protein [Microbacterium oleivorans]